MRNRALHDALREFALEAAALLHEDQRAGAELQFDVIDERRRGGPSLYRYVPLTTDYIGARWERLRALPTAVAAAGALGQGAAGYLRANGIRGDDPEPALRAMLERIYEDATGFGFPEERFEAVYNEVESTLYRDSSHARVVAPLYGVQLESDRVDLDGSMALVRSDCFDAPLQAVDEAAALCVLERDTVPGDPPLAGEAAVRFRQLATALRLYKPGAVALGALGWSAAEGGRWQPVELESSGMGRGQAWVLLAEEEDELREFLGAAWRSTHGGALAWALGRFEMGCSRGRDNEALSDYLLGLRALLDAVSAAGQASLSLRVAALCAEEHERRMVQRRVELAVALERYLMAGGDDEDYVETIGSESPALLVAEMEGHLRALLRDVICGYLAPDLKGVADDILLKAADPAPMPEPPRDQITEELEAVESATLRARRITLPQREEASPRQTSPSWESGPRRAEWDATPRQAGPPPSGGGRTIPAAQALFAPTAGEAFAREAFERASAAKARSAAAAESHAFEQAESHAFEVPEAEPPEPQPAEPEPELPEAEPPLVDPEPDKGPMEEPDPTGAPDGVTPSLDWDDYSAPV